MEQIILNYLSGYVRIKINGKYAERFLSLCAFHDIRIWNLVSTKSGYEGNMRRKDFMRLRPVVRKCNTSVRILKKYGLPFWIKYYKKRKLFLIGIAAALCLILFLSAHIWNIKIEGNYSYSDDQVLEFLYKSQIRHGVKKRSLNCKELADQIRDQFDSFSWVSVEMKGTVLTIHIKETSDRDISDKEPSALGMIYAEDYTEENDTAAEDSAEKMSASSLYAKQDGIIRSVYVRSGISHISPGDEVKKGMLLISGVIPVYNDSGEIFSMQYVNADADIVIERKIKYSDIVEIQNTGRWFSGKEKHRYLVKIGTFVLGQPLSSLQFKNPYTILQSTYQMRVLEHFYLPIYLHKLTAKEYKEIEIIYTKERCEQSLSSDFKYFIKNLKEKGVQIFENDVKIEWNEKSAILSGDVTVGETLLERRPVADVEEEIQKNEYG